MADEIGCTPGQVALSWARQGPGVIIPLLGARNLAQLEDNLGCLAVTLTEAQRGKLDDASRIDLGFPHDFLGEEYIRGLVFGGTYDRLDRHREG